MRAWLLTLSFTWHMAATLLSCTSQAELRVVIPLFVVGLALLLESSLHLFTSVEGHFVCNARDSLAAPVTESLSPAD